MTPEELAAAIKEAVEESTAGLVAKNKELLGTIKTLKKGQEIDPQTVTDLENKIDSLESELSNSQKSIKEKDKLLEKAQNELQSESGFTSKLLLDNGLTDALVKAGVAAPLLPAVKAMLAAQAKVTIDGDSRKAVIGDKDLNAFVKDWAASDEGKHYIQAPNNSGGGAGGNQGNKTSSDENLTPAQRLTKGLAEATTT